ncbi:MAG: hypothetical protein ACSHXD_09840 [Marinosulfonomonas sp.]
MAESQAIVFVAFRRAGVLPHLIRRCVAILTVMIGLFCGSLLHAAPGKLIVKDDPGGSIRQRVELISSLSRSKTFVEIRGRYCFSACTLYLALGRTCVLDTTIFGFHGPASRIYGFSLPPKDFEYWSNVMANHYPEPLRSWFLKTGRFRTVGFYEITGAQLIEYGIPQCKTA